MQAAISAAKNRGEDAEAFSAKAYYIDERRASIARVFQLYEERLQKNNALDFDDLLIKAVRLLRDVPEVREKYNDRFRYLLVDEYQDTNQLQFALIRLLTERQQNICVVGDPDQSIYRWRGADIQNILKFEEHFPSAKVIRLEENLRYQRLLAPEAYARFSDLGRGQVIALRFASDEELRGAPSTAPDQEFDWGDRSREAEIHSYYRVPPYWGAY